MKELEDLIKLAHIVSKPFKIAVYVLSGLLAISILGNVYQATHGTEIDVLQGNEYSNKNTIVVK